MELEELKGNIIDAGRLEILSFLPEPVLKGVDLDTIDLPEFMRYLAQARYLQEVWKNVIVSAVAELSPQK